MTESKTLNGLGSNDGLDRFIVSVVMVKAGRNAVNVQNKLYGVEAVSREEAHGKVLALLADDFPEHSMHTICSYCIFATNAQS